MLTSENPFNIYYYYYQYLLFIIRVRTIPNKAPIPNNIGLSQCQYPIPISILVRYETLN